MPSMTIKQLDGKAWIEVPVEKFMFTTFPAMLRSFDETDTVVEMVMDSGATCYICGKEKYRKQQQDKGRMAVMCSEVAKLYPHYHTLFADVVDVFRPDETRAVQGVLL